MVGYGDVFARMTKALEREQEDMVRAAEAPAPLFWITDPSYAAAVKNQNVQTGRERLAAVQRNLDGFGLKRSKNQRRFHRQMIQAVIRKIFKTDLPENLDALREEFGVDEFKSEVMIITPRRWGKCLAPSTLVRMADGTAKPASDVRVGDLLVGDNGRPRVVMNTCAGRGPMFRISEVTAGGSLTEQFSCNDAHLLVFEIPNPISIRREPDGEFSAVERRYDERRPLGIQEKVTRFPTLQKARRFAERIVREDVNRETTVTLRAADVHAAYGNGPLPADFSSVRCRMPTIEVVGGTKKTVCVKSRYQTAIESLGEGEYCGFQCAAINPICDPDRIRETFQQSWLVGGADLVDVAACLLADADFIIPSTADGRPTKDGVYPGRFLLANHTVVHNTYSVGMFVAAIACGVERTEQAIFSTGRRASEKLLQLIAQFICKLPGMKESIVKKTVETIWIQGPCGHDDIRKISSYPSKASLRARAPPPSPSTKNVFGEKKMFSEIGFAQVSGVGGIKTRGFV